MVFELAFDDDMLCPTQICYLEIAEARFEFK